MNRHQVFGQRLLPLLCCWLALVGVGVSPAAFAQESEPATIVVQLHPDGELTIDGAPTTQTGPERRFQTPALAIGKQFHYVLKATWNEKGHPESVGGSFGDDQVRSLLGHDRGVRESPRRTAARRSWGC
jgi:uncharacterized protein (TIGR03000 family)